MHEVIRYDAVHLRYEDSNIRYGEGCEVEVVTASDYAALEAECANLKNSLLAITARHFAESWKKRTNDAELEQYLSAGIAQLESECERLRAENIQLIEDRARFPDKPDFIGNMIAAHFGNLRAGEKQAQKYAASHRLRMERAEEAADTLRQQHDKLAQALENVDREHELLHRMKNCEIRRDRGSFGIAVMSDTLALEWQAFDKELQQLIDARRAALAETNRA